MLNDRHEEELIATPSGADASKIQGVPLENHLKDSGVSSDEPLPQEKKSVLSIFKAFWNRICSTYKSNSFLINIVIVILLAYLYPPLGAIYFAPQITASWIAVIIIFFLSGLSLKTDDFKRIFKRLHFILFVQSFNFFIVSVIMYGVSRFMIKVIGLQEELGDGLVICSCLPMVRKRYLLVKHVSLFYGIKPIRSMSHFDF